MRDLIVYPAIDLRGGRAVRLSQGDFGREQQYDADPVARAGSFVDAGAQWLHVVDLDAARGTGDNRATVASIARLGTPVQAGGGVRDLSLLGSDVARLVVGSLLLTDRAALARMLDEAPDQIALGLDHRGGRLRVSGWEADGGHELMDVLAWDEVQAAAAVIVTDIETDGMLAGPNLEALREVVRRCPVGVICSGGVGSLDDVKAVADAGASGLIIGKALYERRFTLEEALESAA